MFQALERLMACAPLLRLIADFLSVEDANSMHLSGMPVPTITEMITPQRVLHGRAPERLRIYDDRALEAAAALDLSNVQALEASVNLRDLAFDPTTIRSLSLFSPPDRDADGVLDLGRYTNLRTLSVKLGADGPRTQRLVLPDLPALREVRYHGWGTLVLEHHSRVRHLATVFANVIIAPAAGAHLECVRISMPRLPAGQKDATLVLPGTKELSIVDYGETRWGLDIPRCEQLRLVVARVDWLSPPERVLALSIEAYTGGNVDLSVFKNLHTCDVTGNCTVDHLPHLEVLRVRCNNVVVGQDLPKLCARRSERHPIDWRDALEPPFAY